MRVNEPSISSSSSATLPWRLTRAICTSSHIPLQILLPPSTAIPVDTQAQSFYAQLPSVTAGQKRQAVSNVF